MNHPDKFPPPFRLGPWLVSPELNRIQGTEGPVQIEPRVMKVLLCLAETPRGVLTRLDLLDRVLGIGAEIGDRQTGEGARTPDHDGTPRSGRLLRNENTQS